MEPQHVRIENLDLNEAKNEDFDVYAKNKLESWIKMEWRDDNLWEVFLEDFGYFDETTFQRIDKPILRKIHDHLRANGVFAHKQQRYKMARTLAKLLQKKILRYGHKKRSENKWRRKSLLTSVKNYSIDIKNGGNNDGFDYKLSIFYDICNRTNLPDWQCKTAILIMLKDNALSYYYRTLLPKITQEMSFEDVIHSLKNNFEGEAYQRLVKQKWRKVNMKATLPTPLKNH
ncbi:hypothetical protein GcM1_221028b [Golovinomyces cichoracearum]|uniref:Uncharacterized protein n=1 Tax=Golovinomyces cichoracearum TaxID=62708 RepID=A0A420IRR2_9PEZI|nr:hypothetical protein GcM1_221028b [Golovinomyces cichoracearum]